MSGREWNHYLDEITSADVEYEDICRIIADIENEKGVDHLDAEKLMSDLCSLRYRFGFFFMSFQVILMISRPKECIHQSIRDMTRSIRMLRSLRSLMKELTDDHSEEECEACTEKETRETGTEEPGKEGDKEAGEDRERGTDQADPD